MESTQVSTIKYIGYFSFIYTIIIILTNILTVGFEIDLGSSISFVMLIAASYGAATKFVMDNKRVPGQQEKNQLIWGCLLSSIIISVVDVVLVLLLVGGVDEFGEFMDMLKQLPAIWWAVIVVVITGLQYLMLYLIFGWGARKLEQKLQHQSTNKTSN